LRVNCERSEQEGPGPLQSRLVPSDRREATGGQRKLAELLADGTKGLTRLVTGTLYVVATPIGNMGDVTLRAIETLRGVPIVAAEDTRRTRALLEQLGIAGKRLVSLHAHSSASVVERLASELAAGEDIAFATDAGTPLVSDPGSALVAGAIAVGARVVPVPGASAVLAAIVKSGLASDAGFRFMAFLPRDGSRRREAIERVASTPEPVVIFESAIRLAATLKELADAMPERVACVVREITKLYEEAIGGTLSELASDRREWRGEITLVLGSHRPEERQNIDDQAIDARIHEALAGGAHAKAVAEQLAAWSGRPRRELYARVVAMKRRQV
jgi:16S rRNA (cytidine1402-2'-O)-methyltransferase